jgi:signal transduction histidine kinase
MLHEFLTANHDELVKRCRAKVAKRSSPPPTVSEQQYGILMLLGQLVETLRTEEIARAEPATLPANIGSTAGKHGNELLEKGFTVDQVVHDYGDLCQALTELAHEKNAPISVDEFHTFNRCLDNAIADAVTEFGRLRDKGLSEAGAHTMNERLGFLAHELRNYLNSAMLAFEALKGGNTAIGGATGAVLGRSLTGLRDLIDRSLADVRLTDGLQVRAESIAIHELIDDLRIWAGMEAKAKGVSFTITPIEKELAVDADRPMISSAVANLLQNAFKFTRPGGHIRLTAKTAVDRVLVEVEDECGGLPEGQSEELFHSFEQRGDDRTGLDLGLSISRRGVEANGGTVRVRSIAGKGCVFTIDLPRRSHAP